MVLRIARLAVSQEVEVEFGRRELHGAEVAHSQHRAVEFKRLFRVFAANHSVVEAVGFQVCGFGLWIAAFLTNKFDLLSKSISS